MDEDHVISKSLELSVWQKRKEKTEISHNVQKVFCTLWGTKLFFPKWFNNVFGVWYTLTSVGVFLTSSLCLSDCVPTCWGGGGDADGHINSTWCLRSVFQTTLGVFQRINTTTQSKLQVYLSALYFREDNSVPNTKPHFHFHELHSNSTEHLAAQNHMLELVTQWKEMSSQHTVGGVNREFACCFRVMHTVLPWKERIWRKGDC